MKKKYVASIQDKKDWLNFTNQTGNITPKEEDILKKNINFKQIKKLDLHGFSLIEANRVVKRFINESFKFGYKKILIITGKGSRSKTDSNPYLSRKLSVLKYSIPDFIRNDTNLSHKVSKITEADLKDGGSGAIYVFLKKTTK